MLKLCSIHLDALCLDAFYELSRGLSVQHTIWWWPTPEEIRNIKYVVNALVDVDIYLAFPALGFSYSYASHINGYISSYPWGV
jgi:hypothetical protein